MPAIDFKQALGSPTSVDSANIEIQGTRITRTIKLGLFTTNENAVAAGDYLLSKESYPLAKVQFQTNRKLFRFLPGDVFKFVYPKYGIDMMICRVVALEEESVETDKITVTAVEEHTYASMPITSYTEPDDYRVKKKSDILAILTPIEVAETPYDFAGDSNQIVILVPRVTGDEYGYSVYMSLDGEEYYSLYRSSSYSVYGTLSEDYGLTSTIDDTEGVLVTFTSAQDLGRLETISRVELYGSRNLALIGDELITFQTVTPITSTQYLLTGVYRGRYGTQMVAHDAGEPFYFIGSPASISNTSFTDGTTVYFKVVPYTAGTIGSLSSAEVITYTFTGGSSAPYEPINIRSNGEAVRPTYDAEDIVLTWDSRVRGTGAGVGNPTVITDSSASWEGLFRVKFYVNDILVRTNDDINALTSTYTSSQILSDNGKYPNYITAKVSNFLSGLGGVEYESDTSDLLIRKYLITTTTTTTTSTSTTTTTT